MHNAGASNLNKNSFLDIDSLTRTELDSDDIRPMLGLDNYERPPRPVRLHTRAYDATALHRQWTRLSVD